MILFEALRPFDVYYDYYGGWPNDVNVMNDGNAVYDSDGGEERMIVLSYCIDSYTIVL